MCGGVIRKTRRHPEVHAWCAGRYGRQRSFPMCSGQRPPKFFSNLCLDWITGNLRNGTLGRNRVWGERCRARKRGLTCVKLRDEKNRSLRSGIWRSCAVIGPRSLETSLLIIPMERGRFLLSPGPGRGRGWTGRSWAGPSRRARTAPAGCFAGQLPSCYSEGR